MTVSYKVAVLSDGQAEVEIKVDPKNFTIEKDWESEGVLVELEYAKARLATNDPDGYKAVLALWPTVDELVLYRRAENAETEEHPVWEEIFRGEVTKLDTDDHLITVGAKMPEQVPPNPLTVSVVRDPSDLDGLTVQVSADNDDQGPVILDFGDGTPTGHNEGDGATRTIHAYGQAGTYTVVATDEDDAQRTAQRVVTVPFTA